MRSIVSPVAFGIAGLGRTGMYHLERLSLRPDFKAIAAFDQLPSRTEATQSFGCHVCSSWNEFLQQPDIELVVVATPPATHADLATEALAAGKHVVLEPPLCLTSEEAERIVEASRCHGRSVIIAQLRRWDDDFRTALATLESASLGELRTAKLIVWNYGVLLDRSLDASDRYDGTLIEAGCHYFDQLLKLIPFPIRCVYAQVPDLCNEMSADPKSPSSWSFCVMIEFANDVTAQVEVHRASTVPLDTGWVLLGTRGGYRKFRRYEITDAGEVFDVPIEPHPTNCDLFYEQLATHLRDNAPSPVPLEESTRVVALIEAIRESAKRRQPVEFVA